MYKRKTSDLDYIFAVGKIRALERFLIKSEVFEEAIESSLNEALRLFVEADLYGDGLLRIKDSGELEVYLNNELLKLKALVSNLLLDKELINLVNLDTLPCLEKILKDYPSDFLQDYFKNLIDMHNIKTFLRLRIIQEPQEELARYLVCEGFISKDTFLKLYTQELSAFLHRLEYVHQHNRVIDYASFLRDPIEYLEKEKSFLKIEKAINDFLIEALKPAKFLAFGPEPVLAYYFAKVNEINLIRLIILAKFNDVPSDLVKEGVNSVYA